MWPDAIRGDNRFYDDTRANAQPTPLLPGFASLGFLSMARHTNWHYIDIPFSPDGTALEPAPSPNALIELRRILKEANLSAYDLPWLVHLTGDVHQPLHCISRFTKSQPKGDKGGNLVYVTPGRNLHALWDGLAGTETTDAYVNRYAAEITAEFVKGNGQQPRLSKDPKSGLTRASTLPSAKFTLSGRKPDRASIRCPFRPATRRTPGASRGCSWPQPAFGWRRH